MYSFVHLHMYGFSHSLNSVSYIHFIKIFLESQVDNTLKSSYLKQDNVPLDELDRDQMKKRLIMDHTVLTNTVHHRKILIFT